MKKNVRILFAVIIIMITISAIFFFSEQTGNDSHAESMQVAGKIAELIASNSEQTFSENDIQIISKALNHPIRKLAHIFIYFCLGFVTYASTVLIQTKKKRPSYILLCLLIVISVAFADEINQFYSGGRGSSVTDVVIDTAGGVLGIYFYFIITDFAGHIKALIHILKSKE